jgi:hypothetical protein
MSEPNGLPVTRLRHSRVKALRALDENSRRDLPATFLHLIDGKSDEELEAPATMFELMQVAAACYDGSRERFEHVERELARIKASMATNRDDLAALVGRLVQEAIAKALPALTKRLADVEAQAEATVADVEAKLVDAQRAWEAGWANVRQLVQELPAPVVNVAAAKITVPESVINLQPQINLAIPKKTTTKKSILYEGNRPSSIVEETTNDE